MTPANALPENSHDGYVAAAYIVFFALILIYVAVMAVRVSRMERRLRELQERREDEAPDLDGSRSQDPPVRSGAGETLEREPV